LSFRHFLNKKQKEFEMKKFWFVVVLLAFAYPSTAEPIRKPKVSLRGSKRVAIDQNRQADKEGLARIADEKELQRFIKAGILVPLPENLVIRVDKRLDPKYRYVRPQVRNFLNDMGKSHLLTFPTKRPLQINSGVRTAERQETLRGKGNWNAAPTKGPTRSSHLTGSTVDIAKNTLSESEVAWLRDFLRQKKGAGQIQAIEEHVQPVFHVMVFRDYGKEKVAPPAPPKSQLAAKPKAKNLKAKPKRGSRKKK